MTPADFRILSVPGSKGATYTLTLRDFGTVTFGHCTCLAFKYNDTACKHLRAIGVTATDTGLPRDHAEAADGFARIAELTALIPTLPDGPARTAAIDELGEMLAGVGA